MKTVIMLAALTFSVATSAQINLGEKPEIRQEVASAGYDGKHNIEIQNNNGEYNLKHLIGQEVTYIGVNDKLTFNIPDPDSNNDSWKYKTIDASALRLKTFRIVDVSNDGLCLVEKNRADSIFANGNDNDLSANFIVQKHYDLVKNTCVGKIFLETGASRRADFWRDYKTRKVYSAFHQNSIEKGTELKCIDVFVDTVRYDLEMTPGNEDFTDNIATASGSRLCLVFETDKYGKIFCPVEDTEVMDPERAQNWLFMGPVLTLKPVTAHSK